MRAILLLTLLAACADDGAPLADKWNDATCDASWGGLAAGAEKGCDAACEVKPNQDGAMCTTTLIAPSGTNVECPVTFGYGTARGCCADAMRPIVIDIPSEPKRTRIVAFLSCQ